MKKVIAWVWLILLVSGLSGLLTWGLVSSAVFRENMIQLVLALGVGIGAIMTVFATAWAVHHINGDKPRIPTRGGPLK